MSPRNDGSVRRRARWTVWPTASSLSVSGLLVVSVLVGTVPAGAVSARVVTAEAVMDHTNGTIIAEPPLPVRTARSVGRIAQSPAYALSEVFTLHSRPGSSKVIYLDFDGMTLDRTQWNTHFDVPAVHDVAPYDTDGDPLTFSTLERTLILEVWQRVSEDFAPFDVDVTTQDPGVNAIRRSSARDNTYGTRVAIATDPDITCTCGGLASMGAFDTYSSSDPRAHDRAQPVWVFPGSLSNAKDVAEAASHEVGHTLGLSHDGTTQPVENAEYYRGQGAWAPLMGVGYYRPLTQWSDGDYGTATNTEDDISVMLSSGLSLIPDDHADGAADATPLPGGHVQTATGVIGTREDVDWFEFRVGGGPTQITVDPATVGANLDVRLRVARRTGEILRTISPVSIMLGEQTVTGLNAQVDLDLTPGTYRLAVDGVGDDDPAFGGYSDYGSLGAYTVTVQTSGLTVATPMLPTALVNRSYAARLSADDDVDGGESGGEVTWAIVAGSLPQGLTLIPSGVLSGTPVTRGTSTITVQVSNGDRVARATLPLHVISPLRVLESTPVTGYIDRPWSTPVPARGGLGPLTFALSSGRLPRGTKLHDSGVISGRPAREESGSADITVTDQRGRTVTATVTWSIYPQIDIATDRLPRGTVGDSYQLSLLASGGAGDLRWTVIRGSLPPGLRMSRSGVLRGVPRAQGTWTARLRASDGTIMDERRLTLRIRR